MLAAHRPLSLIAVWLTVSACSGGASRDARLAERAAAARVVAGAAFPESLDALGQRPGILVDDLPSGYGPQAARGGAFVRVPGTSALGALAFPAMLERLRKAGWTLGSRTDTADSCTPGPQALPCYFANGRDDATITIVPLLGGGYELTATAPSAELRG